MQLTRFDRWLKEKFVYQIQILTLREANEMPPGMRMLELEEKPGRRYKFLYTTSDHDKAEKLLNSLKEQNQMFTTKVIDRDRWYVQFIAPEGRSPTWYLISVFLMMLSLTPVVIWIRGLLSNPEFMKNLDEAKEILKG